LIVIPEYSRHPWRSRYAPPAAFPFAILQTQSRSDIRDLVTLFFDTQHQCAARKSLGPGFRRDDGNGIYQQCVGREQPRSGDKFVWNDWTAAGGPRALARGEHHG
jgi:hypothetical protein